MRSHKPNDMKCCISTDRLYLICTLEEGNFKREVGEDGYDTFTIKVKRDDIRRDDLIPIEVSDVIQACEEKDSLPQIDVTPYDLMPDMVVPSRLHPEGLEFNRDIHGDISRLMAALGDSAPPIPVFPVGMSEEEIIAQLDKEDQEKEIPAEARVISKERFFQASQLAEKKRMY